MTRDTMKKYEIEEKLETILDKVWRHFRPTESAYWKGNLTRIEFLQKTFEICSNMHKSLVQCGLAHHVNDPEEVWVCALRVVAVTFNELPKLADPESGYHSPGEYRIVKTKKCPQQKNLVRELAALLMYNYGELE